MKIFIKTFSAFMIANLTACGGGDTCKEVVAFGLVAKPLCSTSTNVPLTDVIIETIRNNSAVSVVTTVILTN